MITAIQAAAGASRWCELAQATPESAAVFLEIFPDTMFVCVYRALPGVLAEGLASNPWGLGGTPFWAYAGHHPGNNVATIANYWVANMQQLLEFETHYSHHCARVRYEDLVMDQESTAETVFRVLGLDAGVLTSAPPRSPVMRRDTTDDLEWSEILNRLPAALMRTINDLSARLGYPAPGGVFTEATGQSEKTAIANRADTVGIA
jgi:hypothetical protein